jgi:signal transduction histidine kinase/ligand-binding sensor domain-containing protein
MSSIRQSIPWLFFAFLLLIFEIQAQERMPRFRNFGIREGLSTSSVTKICQDKEGKIWIGTHDGLNCFYGTHFRNFYQDRKKQFGLKQSAISDLLCDRNGRLWIATYGGGISLMDPVSQEFLPIPEPLRKIPWIQTNSIAEDSEGKIWIGFYEGLLIYNPANGSIKRWDKIPGSNTTLQAGRINFDSQENAFVATPFQGIHCISNSGKNWLASLPFDSFGKAPSGLTFFHQLYPNRKGILACTQAGILKFKLENGKIIIEKGQFETEECFAWLKDANGREWFADGQKSLRIVNKNSLEIPLWLHYQGNLPSEKIVDIFQDRWGGIWTGGSGGLSYSHPQLSKFNSWSCKMGKNDSDLKIIWSVFTPNDQDFLIGSETGLFQFQNSSYRFIPIQLSGDANDSRTVVYSFCRLKNGHILAGTDQGLVEINNFPGPKPNAKKVFPEVQGLISAITELKDGKILFGTYDERGLFLTDNQGRLIKKFENKSQDPNSLINNSVNCFLPGLDGRLWIGTDGGIGVLDPLKLSFDNSLWDIWPDKSKNSPLIYSIVEFDNQVWFATFGSGILVLDKQKRTFKQIGLAEGLPNESVYRLEKQGDMVWASTNRGLCLLDRRTFAVKVFTEGDGLQSDEFNHFSSFSNQTSGKIYFGGVLGFDEVSSYLKPENFNPPRIVLSSARVSSADSSRSLSLNTGNWLFEHDEQNLEIEFAALNYLMPEKNLFAYELSGAGEKRIPLGSKNKITLVNLQAGTYVLKIFGSNNESTWSKQPFQISFTVKPPFWGTWWFRLLAGLLVLSIIILIFSLYLKARLREQTLDFEKKAAVRKERSRISAEMHDDLGSGLTSIKMLSELMHIRTGNKSEPELQKIAQRSDEMVESLNTIVWALNDRNDRLEHVIAYLRSYTSSAFEDSNIALELEINMENAIRSLEIHGEMRRNIFLILKESINNIFKHSGANKVLIRINAATTGLSMHIIDNGKGINPEKLSSTGNGLKNLQTRATILGGAISFEDNMGGGLQVSFHMPDYNESVIATPN